MPDAALTIDELAAQLGMTTRNIRAYQAKGLIPAPELRGRTGYYGPVHVERLELVRRLQAEGMNLATIGKVVASEASLGAIMLEQFATEEPYEATVAEMNERFQARDPGASLERAEKLGLLELLDDETVLVRSPAVLRRADELIAMGIPVEDQLDAVAVARTATRDMADGFIHLAAVHLIEKVSESIGDPAAVKEEVDRLATLATDVVHTLFREALSERIRSLMKWPAESGPTA
jgi:DNA-binding transcriptional MerR regulator